MSCWSGGRFYNKGYVLPGSHWLSGPFVAKEGRRSLLKISLKNDQWHIAKSWSFPHADLWGEEWSLCWYSKLLRGSENFLHSFCLNIEFCIFLPNKFLVVDWVTAFNSLSGFYVRFIYLYWNFFFEHWHFSYSGMALMGSLYAEHQ